VASLATRLEDRGQIERRQHPRHRHVQELHLTDAGRDTLHAADPLIAAIEQRIVQELGLDDASRLTTLLHRVADTVGSD
jgi:DNA-binding MarR family transcriptional regulator